MSFFFGFRRPKGGSTLRHCTCSAEVNSACAKVLRPRRKTLVRRRRAAGQKAGLPVLLPLLLLSKSNPLRWASIWFWVQTWKCGVYSVAMLQLVASDISLATSFFISWQSSSRAHSAASRFQITTAALGCDLVLGANSEVLASILLRCSKNRQAPSGACQFLPIHASRAPAAQPAHSLEWRGSRSACDRSIRR